MGEEGGGSTCSGGLLTCAAAAAAGLAADIGSQEPVEGEEEGIELAEGCAPAATAVAGAGLLRSWFFTEATGAEADVAAGGGGCC